MPKKLLIALVVLLILLGGGFFLARSRRFTPSPTPTPTEEPVMELAPENQPQVSLKFSPDSHYVTVNMENLHAAALEYNLIYEAMVKKSRLQTGVNASTKLEGQTTYSKEQLLGSESSGKFTYHTSIQNAVMELTLRDAKSRSIFTATYPFTVSPGKSIDLNPPQ